MAKDAGHEPAPARRQARYEEEARLNVASMSITSVATQIGAGCKTIRRWLALGHAPTWAKPPRRGGVLSASTSHLDGRWAEGYGNTALLWREATGPGFAGAYSTVRAWTRRRRREKSGDGDAEGQRDTAGQAQSPRQMARLLTTETDAGLEADQAFLSRLLAKVPALGESAAVAKRLARLLRREGDETLDQVLADAAGTNIEDFAAGLECGRAAEHGKRGRPRRWPSGGR